jgi:type IV pilus assembly protein PilM
MERYMSILTQIQNAFGSARETFATPGDEVLGIDIGSSSIKIIELHRKSGRTELFTYGEVALGPYEKKSIGEITHLDTDTLATAVKDLLTASSVQTRDAIIGVPATQSLIFLLTLPNIAKSNLSAVIPNEARKFIPVSLSEVVLDWLPLPFPITDQPNVFQVLVAATRAEALAALKDVALKAEVNALGYELEVFAQIRSLLQSEISSVLLIDVGALKTRVSVVRQGVVYNSRMLSFGSASVTQSIARTMKVDFVRAEDMKKQYGMSGADEQVKNIIMPHVTQLLHELQAVVRQYEHEYTTNLEKLVFLGGGIQMPGLMEYLTEGCAPLAVVRSNAFSTVLKPRFLDPVVTAIDPIFATCIGLAERHFDS